MPLVAPDYFAGALDPTRGALILFQEAGWIRRRCNEISAEPELDAIKIYDLAARCFFYRKEADKWRVAGEVTQVLAELVRLTQAAGIGNAIKPEAEINEDYKQLYIAAGDFLTWATANLPQAGQSIPNPTVTVNRTWPNPDLTCRVVKNAAIANAVNALRSVFV